jgi:hypothetical protein
MKTTKLTVCCLMTALILAGLFFAQEAMSGSRANLHTAFAVLSDAEAAGLIQMREEEKLAHDVYLAMYTKYGKRIFSNIMVSEQRHMDAVKGLLDKYNLQDPAEGKAVGKFESADIQALYNELLATGMSSLAEAFGAGVRIEEMDIEDLEGFLKDTEKADIQAVYTNLLNGSYNHLSAFNSQLELIGAVY